MASSTEPAAAFEGADVLAKADVTVTVVSWNTVDLLRSCLRTLCEDAAALDVEIHVVDNASDDGSVEMVRREFPSVRIFANNENVGFARANNQSWQHARGRYWLLLNSDTEVQSGALRALINFMDAHLRAGLVTARLVNPDGTPQFCAQPAPCIGSTLLEASRLHKLLPVALRNRILLSTYWTYDEPIQVGWTWGTALMARREAVEAVGPLSEDFFMYGEDVEWCLRMRRKGWQIWFCPQAEVLHHGGQSAAKHWNDDKRSQRVRNGYFQAVREHRGRWYAVALQAVTSGALALEKFTSRFKR